MTVEGRGFFEIDCVSRIRHHDKPSGSNLTFHEYSWLKAWPILVAGYDQRRGGDGLHLIGKRKDRRPPSLNTAQGPRGAWHRVFTELLDHFAPATRVLVLMLHAGRTDAVIFNGFPAEGFKHFSGSLRFFGKLLAFIRGGAVTAAADHQRPRPVRVGEAEMQRRKTAHRQADDMGFFDL